MLTSFVICLYGLICFFLGIRVAFAPATPSKELPDLPTAWHQLDLCCGDNEGYLKPDADPALSALRRAGWYVERMGDEKGSFVYFKALRPAHEKKGTT